MVTSAFPLKPKEDYEWFRDHVSRNASTYEEWLDFLKRKEAQERLQYTTPDAGGSYEVVFKPAGKEAVAVGDSPYDAQAAGKANVRTMGVLCGGFAENALRQARCAEVYLDRLPSIVVSTSR
jgi:phosphoglycolate phosphatase-like HAD superfamily hydrolase